MKKIINILAIETSCDETAAAVIEVQRISNQLSVISTAFRHLNSITDNKVLSTRILSNVIASQIDLHKQFGGVFPEQASRAHAETIIPVIQKALDESKSKINDIDVIAVTTGPGLIGSLLIGVQAAKTLAYAKNKPVIGINHWLGHIYSNFKSHPEPAGEGSLSLSEKSHSRHLPAGEAGILPPTRQNDLPSFPALILIVSGGHTGLVLMKSHDEIVPLGETLDDAAGEAFDKVSNLLGLGYPGGPIISKVAEKGDSKAYNFPRSMVNRSNFDFSFSGLKTAVLTQTKKMKKISAKDKADLAASFQQAVLDILIKKTIQAAYKFKPKSICLCGGVSANKSLRKEMGQAVFGLPFKCSYNIPEIILSTDNAAMIGIAAAYHLDNETTYDKISADANAKL